LAWIRDRALTLALMAMFPPFLGTTDHRLGGVQQENKNDMDTHPSR
jgi:hypothetical protein